MLEIEARRYTPRQIARWRVHEHQIVVDHTVIGEAPHRTHRHKLTGRSWMPDGLPREAHAFAVGNECGHVYQPFGLDGRAVFPTGFACFRWRELAVVDNQGRVLWETGLDLGTKRADDVWVVTIGHDPD